MNILLLGGGGREHAIAWTLAKSKRCTSLFVAPGNAGTASLATNIEGIDITNGADVTRTARDYHINLVVIGPEAPLVAGVADDLRRAGFLVFGPDAYNAMLEGSKWRAKTFMREHHLPTASAQTFTDEQVAAQYVLDVGAPIVVKADGLAAGKGVVVAHTTQEALDAVHACFGGAFGQAGKRVVIEKYLQGTECSLLAFLAGGKAICMPFAQDHKRAYAGGEGPNTGGMGAFAPVPSISRADRATMQQIMQHASKATTQAPFPHDFRGVLYGEFMRTSAGPQLLEFNVRFGDPETQVILPLLQNDLVDVMEAVAKGNLDNTHLQWRNACACCVVLTSKGYPKKYQVGKVIHGLSNARKMKNIIVFHAGTTYNQHGDLVTNGGRVLDVVGIGPTFEQARHAAYHACDMITFEGKTYRSDIGLDALHSKAKGAEGTRVDAINIDGNQTDAERADIAPKHTK